MSVCVPEPGEVQAFHEDLNGRQHINEVYKFSVDKLFDILFTESQFMSDFMEQRRISGQRFSRHRSALTASPGPLTSPPCRSRCRVPPVEEGGRREPDQRDHVHHLALQPPGAENVVGQRDAGSRGSAGEAFAVGPRADLNRRFLLFARRCTK